MSDQWGNYFAGAAVANTLSAHRTLDLLERRRAGRDLAIDNALLRERLADVNARLRHAVDRHNYVRDKHNELADRYNPLVEQCRRQSSKIVELTTEVETLKAEVESLRAGKARAEAEVGELKGDLFYIDSILGFPGKS